MRQAAEPSAIQQEGHKQQRQHEQGCAGGEPRSVDPGKELAEVTSQGVDAERPEGDPERSADTVEGGKAPPAHAKSAGDDAVQLPEHDEEPREQNHGAAIARKEALDPVQAVAGDPEVPAESKNELTPAEAADRVADVVPEHRRGPGGRHQRHDVQGPMRGQQRSCDEQRLAGQRQPEGLEEERAEDARIAVAVEVGSDVAQVVLEIDQPPALRPAGEPFVDYRP